MKQDKKVKPEHEAKRNVLKSLSDEMKNEMHGKIKGDLDQIKSPMKKVSVIAPDKESLEKGLEVAKKLAPKMDNIEEALKDAIPEHDQENAEDLDELAEEHMEEEQEPSEEHKDLEQEELLNSLSSEEDIDKMMKLLEEKKKSLKA